MEKKNFGMPNNIGSQTWPLEFDCLKYHGWEGPSIILIYGTPTFLAFYECGALDPTNSPKVPKKRIVMEGWGTSVLALTSNGAWFSTI